MTNIFTEKFENGYGPWANSGTTIVAGGVTGYCLQEVVQGGGAFIKRTLPNPYTDLDFTAYVKALALPLTLYDGWNGLCLNGPTLNTASGVPGGTGSRNIAMVGMVRLADGMHWLLRTENYEYIDKLGPVAVINPGTWYKVRLHVDVVNNVAELYVNDVLQVSTVGSSNMRVSGDNIAACQIVGYSVIDPLTFQQDDLSLDTSEAPPPSEGYIAVRAYADGTLIAADVMLDGQSGTTPVTFAVLAGTYSLTATYQDETLPPQTVTVIEGQTVTVDLHFPIATQTLIIMAIEGGTTDPIPGEYSIPENQIVTISALPATGWKFDRWYVDGTDAGSAGQIDVIMDKDHIVEAKFTEIPPPPPGKHSLTISSTVGGGTEPPAGTYEIVEGTVVSIAATPAPGYNFAYWKVDDSTIPDNPISVTVDRDLNLIATFTPKPSVLIQPLFPLLRENLSRFKIAASIFDAVDELRIKRQQSTV
jgi:hypothetical protein